MKRLVTMAVLLATGALVFAMGTRQSMTEDEALALIDQKIIDMNLTLEDADAAEEAFTAMIEAKVQVRNAFRIVSDALDGGLKAREMTELAVQTRLRIQQGLSAGGCEDAARDMVRERIRTMEQERLQDGTGEGVPAGPGVPAGGGSGK